MQELPENIVAITLIYVILDLPSYAERAQLRLVCKRWKYLMSSVCLLQYFYAHFEPPPDAIDRFSVLFQLIQSDLLSEQEFVEFERFVRAKYSDDSFQAYIGKSFSRHHTRFYKALLDCVYKSMCEWTLYDTFKKIYENFSGNTDLCWNFVTRTPPTLQPFLQVSKEAHPTYWLVKMHPLFPLRLLDPTLQFPHHNVYYAEINIAFPHLISQCVLNTRVLDIWLKAYSKNYTSTDSIFTAWAHHFARFYIKISPLNIVCNPQDIQDLNTTNCNVIFIQKQYDSTFETRINAAHRALIFSKDYAVTSSEFAGFFHAKRITVQIIDMLGYALSQCNEAQLRVFLERQRVMTSNYAREEPTNQKNRFQARIKNITYNLPIIYKVTAQAYSKLVKRYTWIEVATVRNIFVKTIKYTTHRGYHGQLI